MFFSQCPHKAAMRWANIGSIPGLAMTVSRLQGRGGGGTGLQAGVKEGNRSWRDPGDWVWRGARVGALGEGTWAEVKLFPAGCNWQVPHGNGCFPQEGGTWLHRGILTRDLNLVAHPAAPGTPHHC